MGTGSLGEIYLQALERIAAQQSAGRDLAERVLVWLTYAKRRLSIEELQHAIAVEPGERRFDPDNVTDVESMLSVCAGLVAIDSESNIIRLVHHTAQVYLEFHRPWKSQRVHLEIVKTCLTYLSFDELLRAPSEPLGEDWYGRNFHALRTECSLLEYAATYWGDHLLAQYPWFSQSNVPPPPRTEALPEVLEFLKRDYRVSDAIVHKISNNHGEWIRLSASQGVPVKKRNVRYDTDPYSGGLFGLHIGVFFDLVYVVEALLEEGMSVDARDALEETPLSWAARLDRLTSANTLLFHGANANAVSVHGWRPLHHAVSHGFEKGGMVELLLDNGAEVDGRSGTRTIVEGEALLLTPLHVACSQVRKDSAEKLLERGADLLSRDCNGETALSIAVYRADAGLVEILLRAGEKLSSDQRIELVECSHSRSPDLIKPLHLAAFIGHEDIVRRLIAFMENHLSQDILGLTDSDGRTALMYAVQAARPRVVETLLRAGADPTTLDKGRLDCLHLAVVSGISGPVGSRDEVVRQISGELVKKGTTLDAHNAQHSKTPLIRAVEHGYHRAVKILIAAGAGVDAQDCFGRTALYYAAETNHLEIMRLLIQAGADLKALAKGRRTGERL